MAPASYAMAATVDPSYAPRPPKETALVVGGAFLFLAVISIIATLCGRYRRRNQPAPRVRGRAPAPQMVDLEQQACTISGTGNGKTGSHILAFPPLAMLARSRSSSAPGSGSEKLSLGLPPPALAVAPSSRLRDSVLCKALGQLPWPASGNDKNAQKKSRRIIDIEAAAADKHMQSGNTASFDPDSSMSYPEWIRPHLAEIREQSKREWTLYTPTPAVAIPEIIIQSCDDDEPLLDSPASTYSTDSAPSELDTPPPMTPTLASPVSFYFPASPSFSVREYLQVPSPSFNAPREEEKPVMRNVSNFSGKTFALATPPGRFSKMGKLRERRMLAQAQAAKNIAIVDNKQQLPSIGTVAMGVQVMKGCGTGPRVSQSVVSTVGCAQAKGPRVAGLGLGLQLRPQLDFQGSLDKALAASCPSGDEAAHGLPGTFSTAGCLDLASLPEVALAADVALPTPAASQDNACDANANVCVDATLSTVVCTTSDDNCGAKGRPERLARLIDAFDSSFSLASVDSDGGHDQLSSILDDYHFDDHRDLPVSLDNADADSSAITELVVQETQARRAVVVCAI